MNNFDEIKSVSLKDKREIHLNEDDYSLSIVFNGETILDYPMDYPNEGYGGGSLHLSPDNSYLLLSYYSGQSEEAFTLFRVGEQLEMIFNSDYLFGEAASYVFSNDERLLIQCLPMTCAEWWDYAEEYSKKDNNGEMFFDYGYINVLDIGSKTVNEHIIRIYLPDKWRPQPEDYTPFMLPKLVSDNTLKILMPWGEETIDFPLNDIISFSLDMELKWRNRGYRPPPR